MCTVTACDTVRFAILVYTVSSAIPVCNLLATSNRQEAIDTATRLKSRLPKAQRQSTRIKVLDMVHCIATVI